MRGPDLQCLGARLVNEDDGDENGEALFGESSDVADEGAQVERNDQNQIDEHPHSDPEAKCHELDRSLPKNNNTFRVAIAYSRQSKSQTLCCTMGWDDGSIPKRQTYRITHLNCKGCGRCG